MPHNFPWGVYINPVDVININAVDTESTETDSPTTVSALIDAFGGTGAFAHIFAKRQSTAGEMKRSGAIKPKYWPSIIAAARERGPDFDWVTSEALMLMHAPRMESAQ
jgi:hypothetical protein